MKKILMLILFMLISSCEKNAVIIEEPEIYEVSLIAVGDNLIHQTIYQAAAIEDTYDFKPMFKDIKPYIKTFDLAFINQETILGGKELGLSSYPCFNSPHELGDAIIDAGFNLISLANNHVLDRGEAAIASSIGYWQSQKIIYSGSEIDENINQVKYFNMNGIDFAFVAYTYGTNGIKHPQMKMHLANIYDRDKALADIKEARAVVDVIIVSMHWGNEYENYPSQTQIAQSEYLASLGVDIIIGHHPHVIQPVDRIELDNHSTFIIYSLGNFLSDQVGMDRLIGMAVSLNIKKTINKDNVDIMIEDYHARLLYRYKDRNDFQIKQFIDLDERILEDYDIYYNDKTELIKTYFKDITVD